MGNFTIKKGRNIRLAGEAEKSVEELPLPKTAAIQPPDFKGIKPKLIAKLDDNVKVGSPIIADKRHTGIRILSPVSGKVIAVNRGEKRALLEIVIEADGKQEKEEIKKFDRQQIEGLSREDVILHLVDGGLWSAFRQRPFSNFADPEGKPKSIFIHAMSTEPLAADADIVLAESQQDFQIGLDIIRKLSEGNVHLCYSSDAKSDVLTNAQNVEKHTFSGSHPTGNVGTHIHHVDPIGKGDVVWFIEAQDVVRIAKLFIDGAYPVERTVAITGEGAEKKRYVKTIVGAPIKEIVQNSDYDNMRCISGSVLAGRDVGEDGFLGFYDSQVTVFPNGGRRELLGWLAPGVNKFTFSHTFLSSFLPAKNEVSLDTDEHGSHRAIVINNVYDSLNTLDILTYFLLKAVLSGDIEESERLGILECDEEDFALCTFACPSKTDVGKIINQGLEVIEQEG